MEAKKVNIFLSLVLSKLKSQKRLFPIAYFVSVFLIGFSVISAFKEGNGVMPTHEDDCIYFNSAKLFYETGSLKAWGFIDNNVSRIGEFNWYGPGYGLLYGGISKMFSFNEGATIIYFHFLFLLFALYLMSRIIDKKYSVPFLIITSGVIPYLFSFQPVMFHYSASVILGAFLFKYYSNLDNIEIRNRYLFKFLILVFLFSFFRVTTIFWLSGLLADFKSFKRWLFNLSLFFAGLILSIVFIQLFTAPMYISAGAEIDKAISFKLVLFIVNFIATIKNNLILFYSCFEVEHIYLFISYPFLIWAYSQSRSNHLLATMIINFTTIIVMFGLYVGSPFYMEKQIAFLVCLNIMAILYFTNGSIRKVYIISMMLLIPVHANRLFSFYDKSQYAYIEAQSNSIAKDIVNIKYFSFYKPINTLLFSYLEFERLPVNYFVLSSSYPMSDANLNILRYSAYLGEKDIFEVDSKKFIDYYLTTKNDCPNNFICVGKSKYFYLYRKIE